MLTTRWIVIAACGVVVLLVAVPVALLLLVDPNSYKGELVGFVANRTGRPLELSGPLKLSILPRIALSVSGVTVGNPPGFTGQALLSVEQASVGMKLWPLLHHRFEVGRIELSGLQLHLLKNAQGTANWQTGSGPAAPAAPMAPAAPAAPAGKSGPTASPASRSSALAGTTIEGFELRNAEVTYDDAGTDSHWRVQKLNASLGAIDSGRAVPLNLQATVDSGTAERSATISVKAQARLDAQAFDLDSLAMAAVLNDKMLPSGGLPVTLAMPHLQYSSAQSTLDIPQFELALQALQLSGSLSGRQLAAAAVFAGALDLKPINLRSWLGKVGISAPITRDPLALSNVSGHFAFAMNDDGLSVKPFHVVLDASQIDGGLSLPKTAARPTEFQLRLDTIDLDRYLSPKGNAPASAKAPGPQAKSGELPTSSLRALSLRGTLQVKAAKLAGISIEDLSATVDAHDGDLALKPIDARFYGGTYHGTAGIDARAAVPKLTADTAIAAVDLGALLNGLYGSRRLSGRATITSQLNAEGADLDAWLKSLSGRLDATVTNGALEGIDVEYAIAQAVALIGQHALTSQPDTKRTPFSQLNVKNRFTAGVMTTESLNAETPLLKVTGQGTVALANMVTDYHLAASLLKKPDAGAPGGLASLAGATVPFTINGPADKLSIRPDVEGLVKGQLKQQLQQKTQDFTKGLLEKLQGGH